MLKENRSHNRIKLLHNLGQVIYEYKTSCIMAIHLGPSGQLSVQEIQDKTDRYFDYAISKVPSGQQVYLSQVFTNENLADLLSGNYDGVRIILVKEEDTENISGEQTTIGMIAVPVKEVNGEYVNQLGEDDKVIYAACPSKYCKSSETHASLI